MRHVASALAVLLAAAGCAPPDPTAKARLEVDVAKWTALVDHVADVVAADRADCAKMAGDVHALFEANAGLVKDANAALGDGFKLPDDARIHVAAAVDRMMAGVDACGAAADVQKAFKLAKPEPDAEG
jgi:hypothetical protein